MTFDAATFGIVWPALLAGLLVTATHVPLGMQVLARGIVFIDRGSVQPSEKGALTQVYFGSVTFELVVSHLKPEA